MAHSYDEEEPSMERHIHYNKRGELQMVGQKSLFDLDEPVWHADEKSPVCDKCSAAFTFTHRRHHCRRCGEVVCADCMDKVPLVRMRYVDHVVVCKVCIPLCKTEDEFFQNHLKTLTTGAYFHLSDSDDAAAEYLCKLSTDHRQILISQDHLPIAMRHILEVKTLHGEEARLATGAGGEGEVDGGSRKKRSGSNPKNISLELTYKSGGLEHKL
ncbi:Zinc finger FYVE domain-containing protein 21 [Geodia barretti]|uniref:Zinc finger FYVE domain-containing protein 21 n=1 Tax=Geodia barretti TaxID=519541 RepID=A0AA35TVZ7_GEOBA|nr:Zinc finger FYVE domain-containing protein 21 [Geodia barretti]